jgi:hypothetical protein
MIDAVETFMSVFDGRRDAYGGWDGMSIPNPVNYALYAGHLYGSELIGIYPLREDSTVKWGCSDIDVDDLDAARNIQTALMVKGVRSYVEKTRRGYHVWVFADGWIPAPIMRRALLAAHEVIGYPAKEVNPKQEVSSGLGNYVRLPYPNGMNEMPDNRYMLEPNDSPMDFDKFIGEVEENLVSVHQLRPLADMYSPKKRNSLASLETTATVREALAFVDGLVATIWKYGPLEGRDRSNTLCRLVHKMKDQGTPLQYAYVVLKDADKRWGKFHEREDCDEQLTKIIQDIYGTDKQ